MEPDPRDSFAKALSRMTKAARPGWSNEGTVHAGKCPGKAAWMGAIGSSLHVGRKSASGGDWVISTELIALTGSGRGGIARRYSDAREWRAAIYCKGHVVESFGLTAASAMERCLRVWKSHEAFRNGSYPPRRDF